MVTLWRIIRYGLQNVSRNMWLSFTTIGIMVLTLLVFMGLIMFNVFAVGAVEEIKDKVDISVYFKDTVEEDDILNIKQVLEDFEEIVQVEYVSRDEALALFEARHAGDEVVIQTLAELDDNPLLASLNVRAGDLSDYGTIASYLESSALEDMVENVTFAQNELVINRLQRIIEVSNVAVITLTVFLAFLAVMVTLNTISLSIFSNKDQITIMRYVGAFNRFIQGPYVVSGIIFGFVAAVVSFLITVPIINVISPYITGFVPSLDMSVYLLSNSFTLFLYQLAFGVGLGVISSVLAVRKYLRA